MDPCSKALAPWIVAAAAIAGSAAAQPVVDEPLDPWRHERGGSEPPPSIEPDVGFVDPWGDGAVVYRPGELADPWREKAPQGSGLVEDPSAPASAEGPTSRERELEPLDPWQAPAPPAREDPLRPRTDDLVDPWPGEPLALRPGDLADPWPETAPLDEPHNAASEPPTVAFPPADETAGSPLLPRSPAGPDRPAPSGRSATAFPPLDSSRAQP